MAIGSKVLRIGWEDFVRGISTSDDMSDAGFSPHYAVSTATPAGDNVSSANLQLEPGVLNGAPATTDGDSDVVLGGNIVASCPDHALTSQDPRLVVTDAGKYIRYNGTKLGAVLQTDADTYNAEVSQMVNFAGATYVSSQTELHKWSGASTFDNAFHTFAINTGPHPLIVFEDMLFIGDGPVLKRITADGGTIESVLTLVNTADRIVAFGIDKGTGRLLISTTGAGQNMSNTLPAAPKLMWYDGESDGVDRYVHVEDQITGFVTIGNITFVGYGQNLGYLSGSGIQFLRHLNVTLAQANLPYQNRMCKLGNTLYVAEHHQILAFGEIVPGQKVFWYLTFENDTGSRNDYKHIFSVGYNTATNYKLGTSFATNKFYTHDLGTATGPMRFTSRKYFFERPIYIRKIVIEHKDAVPDANNGRGLTLLKGLDTNTVDMGIEGNSSVNLQNNTGGNLYRIDNIIGMEEKVYTLQLRYNSGTTKMGVNSFLVYYDVAE